MKNSKTNQPQYFEMDVDIVRTFTVKVYAKDENQARKFAEAIMEKDMVDEKEEYEDFYDNDSYTSEVQNSRVSYQGYESKNVEDMDDDDLFDIVKSILQCYRAMDETFCMDTKVDLIASDEDPDDTEPVIITEASMDYYSDDIEFRTEQGLQVDESDLSPEDYRKLLIDIAKQQ